MRAPASSAPRRLLPGLALLGAVAATSACGGEAPAPPSELGRWKYGVPRDEEALAARRLNLATGERSASSPAPAATPAVPPAPPAPPKSPPAQPTPTSAPPTPAPPAPSTIASGDYRVVAVEDGGTVRVRVKLKDAPASVPRIEVKKDTTKGCVDHASERVKVAPDGSLGNAIVSLRGIRAGKDWPEAWRGDDRALVVDQKACVYVPHVAVVPPGTQLVILNSDAAEHNIHGYKGDFSNTKFNVSSPPGSRVADVSEAYLEEPAAYVVKCDIHPWMNAIYFVAPHPYHEVTSEQADPARGTEAGEVVFADVPPGTYEVVVWHEGMVETPVLSDGKISGYSYSADVVETAGSVTVTPKGTVAREVAIPYR